MTRCIAAKSSTAELGGKHRFIDADFDRQPEVGRSASRIGDALNPLTIG
jgi:hypothetical protein